MSKDSLSSVLKGALIAAAGAALPYALSAVSLLPLGPLSPAVGAVASVLVNLIRKWITDNQSPAPTPKA